MTPQRTIDQIDLSLLPLELAAKVNATINKSSANPLQVLPEIVDLIVGTEPDGNDRMIEQARQWFTRNLESMEEIEKACKSAAPIEPSSDLSSLENVPYALGQAMEACYQSRLLAMRSLQKINRAYQLHQSRQLVTEPEVEKSTSPLGLRSAFMEFYEQMGEVAFSVANAKLRVIEHETSGALADEYHALEKSQSEREKRQQRIDEIERHSNRTLNENSARNSINRMEMMTAMMNGRPVRILDESEYAQLLHHDEKSKVEDSKSVEMIKAIEQIQKAFEAKWSERDIVNLIMTIGPLVPVAQHWLKAARDKRQLEDDLAALRPLAAAQKSLEADVKEYDTRSIRDYVRQETGVDLKTDKVTYHLERLAKRKRIAPKEQDIKWWLNADEFELATQDIIAFVKNQMERKRAEEAKAHTSESKEA